MSKHKVYKKRIQPSPRRTRAQVMNWGKGCTIGALHTFRKLICNQDIPFNVKLELDHACKHMITALKIWPQHIKED